LRKSNKEAAQTREAIVAAAADLIRRTGISEASLADVMQAAGLTHGGFYRHFRTKQHLVADALAAAGDQVRAAIGRNMAKGGLNAAIDGYLSTAHRDSPTPNCPFAAVGSEVARGGKETKAAATEVLEKLFVTLAGDEPDRDRARGDAIVALFDDDRRYDPGAHCFGQRSVSGNPGVREEAPAPIGSGRFSHR
jgi:TetR/AcrR family transcriptional repressor of nem operon